MGRLQNNPSIRWVHPKSTHAHPLTWGNKKRSQIWLQVKEDKRHFLVEACNVLVTSKNQIWLQVKEDNRHFLESCYVLGGPLQTKFGYSDFFFQFSDVASWLASQGEFSEGFSLKWQ